MPQTGKTPKKQSSESQKQFKEAYSTARKQAGNVDVSTSPVGTRRREQRREQTQGRMSFGRGGSLGHRPQDTAANAFDYKVLKQWMAMDNPAVPTPPTWMRLAAKRMAEEDYRRMMWKQNKVSNMRKNAEIEQLQEDIKTLRPRTPEQAAQSVVQSGQSRYQSDVMVPQRVPNMRNRPRGRSVTGMMSMGAGLGIGQILRGMMNKEESKRR